MAAFIIKDAQALYGGRDVSGILNQVGITYSSDLKDASVLTSTARERIAGLLDAEISIQGFWDGDDDLEFFNDIGGAGEVTTILGDAHAEGSRAYFLNGVQASYEQGAAIGEIYPFTLNSMSKSPLIQGVNIAEKAAIVEDGNGSNFTFAAVAADERMFAVIHALTTDGSTPTLDVIIRSDSDGTFDSVSTDRITFAQIAGLPQAQVLSVAGPITDTFWRADWTVTGGSPSYDFLIAIGITNR